MKAPNYYLFVIIILVCISCVSSKGYNYYRWSTKVPLKLASLDDSTFVMHYANALTVTRIHYDVDTIIHHDIIGDNNHPIYVSNLLFCTVKKVDIIDNLVYDYLNKEISGKGIIREHLICEGDKITIFNHKSVTIYYIDNKSNDHLLPFYSKPYMRKIRRWKRRG